MPDLPPLRTADQIAAYATASMDVSDGLIGDLQKLITASRSGAHLELDLVELYLGDEHPGSERSLEETLACCTGGDDYQCLFTAPESASAALKASLPGISNIGRIERAPAPTLRLTWCGNPVQLPPTTGYSH